MDDALFAQRSGGRTFRVSPLDGVFFDDHESWYAVHWSTSISPFQFLEICEKYLNLNYRTPTILRSSVATVETSLNEIYPVLEKADSIEFLRCDTRDMVLVWEPNAEYQRLATEGDYAPFRATIGFGSDKFDPEFGLQLFSWSATNELGDMAKPIWESLTEIIGDRYSRQHINPQELDPQELSE